MFHLGSSSASNYGNWKIKSEKNDIFAAVQIRIHKPIFHIEILVHVEVKEIPAKQQMHWPQHSDFSCRNIQKYTRTNVQLYLYAFSQLFANRKTEKKKKKNLIFIWRHSFNKARNNKRQKLGRLLNKTTTTKNNKQHLMSASSVPQPQPQQQQHQQQHQQHRQHQQQRDLCVKAFLLCTIVAIREPPTQL